MFTGIIQKQAQICDMKWEEGLLRYAVSFPKELLYGLKKGASVSIDGICQTVVSIEGDKVWFDAIQETLSKTTLSSCKVGKWVNIERAAKVGDEIGGHLLSGHIMDTAEIYKIEQNIFTFKVAPQWIPYFFPKGFTALDGISLTLVTVDKKHSLFTVHLIPETLRITTLGWKKEKERVNFEIDALTQAAVDTIHSLLKA